jgi:ABC-2 type transport system ATP-binding protein
MALSAQNGAGKSTFLRLCNGIYKPDEGHISINGGEVFDNPAVKEHCVFVPDELYFLPQSNLNRMSLLYESMYPRFSRNALRISARLLSLIERVRSIRFPKECADRPRRSSRFLR